MIGATTGKKQDHIADGDLKTMDEMRGAMKELNDAKLSLGEKGTVAGIQSEIAVVKQRMDMMSEQMNTLVAIYQTLQNEFTEYKHQRVTELNMRVNHGSTTPED